MPSTNCCIHDCGASGVLVHGGARATIENSNIHSNAEAGVLVTSEGTEVVMRGNTIHDGKAGGVCVGGQSKATLEDNEIHSNNLSGVEIRDKVRLRTNPSSSSFVCPH